MCYQECKSSKCISGENIIEEDLPLEHLPRKALCVLFENHDLGSMLGLLMFNQVSKRRKCIIIAEFSGLLPNN